MLVTDSFPTGRLTLVMETTKSIVSKEPMTGTRIEDEFSEDRQPFEHEQLLPIDNLSVEGPKDVAGKEKLYSLASEVGMLHVLRWKPRLVREFTLLSYSAPMLTNTIA